MNEELKRLIALLDEAGYKVFGIDVDGLINNENGTIHDIMRVRLALSEPEKTMTREEFEKLTQKQRLEFLKEEGRIA
jgi:hypothetical protein